MRMGRCVKTDFGFVGCYADVMPKAERRCSARRRCTISVPDAIFDGMRPCNDDLKSYFEARFKCISGKYIIITPYAHHVVLIDLQFYCKANTLFRHPSMKTANSHVTSLRRGFHRFIYRWILPTKGQRSDVDMGASSVSSLPPDNKYDRSQNNDQIFFRIFWAVYFTYNIVNTFITSVIKNIFKYVKIVKVLLK